MSFAFVMLAAASDKKVLHSSIVTLNQNHCSNNMDLMESIRTSTSTHENLLVSLDPELNEGQDVNHAFAYLNWINHNQDG